MIWAFPDPIADLKIGKKGVFRLVACEPQNYFLGFVKAVATAITTAVRKRAPPIISDAA